MGIGRTDLAPQSRRDLLTRLKFLGSNDMSKATKECRRAWPLWTLGEENEDSR